MNDDNSRADPSLPTEGYVCADEAKNIVNDVLQRALAGYENDFKSESGYVQWGKVKREIHQRLDKAAHT